MAIQDYVKSIAATEKVSKDQVRAEFENAKPAS
jgi:hypothetical protein